MKTYSVRPQDIQREWHVIDAQSDALGRVASRAAQLLRGKNKPYYSPHIDCGDHVVIINAARLQITGRKLKQKIYYRHSGYPGGLRATPLETMLQKHPTRAVEHAVRGMLPHTILGRKMLKKLHVHPGPEHPHRAQIAAQERKKQAASHG